MKLLLDTHMFLWMPVSGHQIEHRTLPIQDLLRFHKERNDAPNHSG